jgi:S1-C subfamily serine protease
MNARQFAWARVDWGMQTMRDRDGLKLALGLAVMVLVLAAPQGLLGQSTAQSADTMHKIAMAGNKGVVAVYCMRDEWESYFGTGTVLSPDGYVLTSTTVVPPGIEEVYVHFTDYRVMPARVVEIKEELEGVLLKVDATKLDWLPVARAIPGVGEHAYTVGNADHCIRLSGHASFSAGMVSGVYEVTSGDSQSVYTGLAIETTAAINPGQDGGPLLNASGQVVGMISLGFSESRWQGTAVPMTKLIAGMKTLRDGAVRLGQQRVVEPPHAHTAAGNPLSATASKMTSALVSVLVTRAFPAEPVTPVTWQFYRKSVENWDQLSPQQKLQAQSECLMAEYTLNANRMIRRPDEPVTGVVISPDGYVLTSAFNVGSDTVFKPKTGPVRTFKYDGNLASLLQYDEKTHTIEVNPVKSVTVIAPDGRELPARVVSRHLPLGVALLKVEAKGLTHLDLASVAGEPFVGQTIGVMGCSRSKGAAHTLNSGIVSAANRNQGARFQITSLLNYGNSGGLIVDGSGRVVGLALDPMRAGGQIHGRLKMPAYPKVYGPLAGRLLPMAGRQTELSLSLWQAAPNSGIGFGAYAEKILDDLPEMMKGKEFLRGESAYIGIKPQLNAKNLFADEVQVGTVEKGSPAEVAGLKTGDKILRLNDQPVQNWKDFMDLMQQFEPGDMMKVMLLRKGGSSYVEIDGRPVRSDQELKKVLNDMKDGQEFTGRKIMVKDEELTLDVKLGEQP